MSLLQLELKLLAKNRAFLVQLGIYLTLTLCAIFIGLNHYQSQLTAIDTQIQYHQSDKTFWQNAGEKATPGALGYYLYAPVVKTPSPWSILFKGESQELLMINRVRMLALQAQLYNEPINNTEHLRLSWLDLGVVWVYLLPLLIGFITVTRLADDKDTGRWHLFSINPNVTERLLGLRISASITLLFALNILVLLAVVAFTSITFSLDVVWLIVVLFCYMVFWACVSYLISKLIRQASLSVLTFVIVWLCFCIVIPAARYTAQLDVRQSQKGVSLMLEQRQSINNSWDRNKQADLDSFLAAYPKWQDTSKLSEKFDWKWYYAMQTLSDDAVRHHARDYDNGIRNANSAYITRILSPVLNTELLLSRLADTDRQSDLHMKSQVAAWHNELKDYWYPHLFFKQTYSSGLIEGAPRFSYQAQQSRDAVNLTWVLIAILILAVIGKYRKLF